MPPDPRHEPDHALARRVLAGSQPHWHAFIDRYTPLIRSVLRRYLRDDDAVADGWTAVLARLRDGQLAQYDGRSSLATWLVLAARSEAIDRVRRERGRRREPPALADLPALHQAAYRELFLRGLDPDAVRHRLRADGLLPEGTSLAEVVADLEDHLGDHTLEQQAWDLAASRAGVVSGRLLRYLDHAAAENAAAEAALSPERRLLQDEARRTLARVDALIDALPDQERAVIERRFRHGMGAPAIATELSLRDQREVYTITERALRLLRRMLGLGALICCLLVSRKFFW